jgi:hypothetical protein
MGAASGDEPENRRTLHALLAAIPADPVAFHRVAATIGTASSAVKWDRLLDAAAAHGVLAVLTPYLCDLGLPGAVREEIERRAVIQQLWNRQVRGSLEHAACALAQRGVKPCVLKGPVLGERLYPTAAARPSMDVDLLVQPGDIDFAVQALREAGYDGDSDADASYLLRHGHHLHFTRAAMPAVELHFHAYAGFGAVLPAAALIDRAVEHRLTDDVAVLVPSAEDEFVYLAVHAAGHSFIRLVWLYDLKLLLRRQAALDWTRITSVSQTSSVTHAVAYTIRLLETWLGIQTGDLPEPLRHHGVRSRIADRLLAEVSMPQPRSPRDNLGGLVFTSLLCDTVGSTTWLLQHHIGRMMRRRLKRRAQRYLPDGWSA